VWLCKSSEERGAASAGWCSSMRQSGTATCTAGACSGGERACGSIRHGCVWTAGSRAQPGCGGDVDLRSFAERVVPSLRGASCTCTAAISSMAVWVAGVPWTAKATSTGHRQRALSATPAQKPTRWNLSGCPCALVSAVGGVSSTILPSPPTAPSAACSVPMSACQSGSMYI
jgi:hypothetical protein